MEEKKNTSRKQDDKKEANTSSDGKESCEEKASDKGTKSRGSEKTNKKGTSDGDVTGSDKDEKKGVRNSGRTARQFSPLCVIVNRIKLQTIAFKLSTFVCNYSKSFSLSSS